jgi:hypothetical protein
MLEHSSVAPMSSGLYLSRQFNPFITVPRGRPAGSQPPFRVRQSLNLYPAHYKPAFARFASSILYPLRIVPPLQLAYSLCGENASATAGSTVFRVFDPRLT